jgi:RNA polymerase sigma factor for flagellar operon FliA
MPRSAKAESSAKASKNVKYTRTDVLDKSPLRRRVASPVSAPLVCRKNTVETGELTSADQEKLTARQAKRQHEDGLWNKYITSRDLDARNDLWVYYQSLVRYIAERQKTKLPECVEVGDLISSGNMGLMDAIQKFDPTMGVRFETYCVPRIRGAMLDSIRANDWVPRLIRNKNHQYERLIAEMATELGREPSDEEVSDRLNMDLKKFHKLKKELDVKSQISMEAGANENSDPRDLLRLEMFESREENEPTATLQREEIRDLALKGLNINERMVVEQYYFHGRSMKQIGEELELSESRVCQIHTQVLEILRRKFRAYEDSCAL